ncbi:hypothetical protein GPECTOR_39g457 [Gonium pectorale]|uniref:Uncharacterized protein n=1 Tax=Gonium pectorale TaxID=33097 RepID=A0A150GB14_GONPE|nr:hypothetical protein GPECTOR_39g457 [Gonium pectorale]|eukprot:KXZ46963.1 hypothetical protein GPECTOR_39g457 [Gonium pectorale]
MTATSAAAELVTAFSATSSAVTAAGGGLTLLSFTPATAAIGGLLLGLATAAKLLFTGRVLGISGAVKGLVAGDPAPWRVAFLLGLALGALGVGGLMPSAIEAIPATFPVWRAVLAGLLVGLGSALGNGCTSGHGICGSARLSPRSFVYTGSFMASGMATATLANTAAALNVAPLPAQLLMPAAPEVQLAMGIAAAGAAAFAGLAAASRLLVRRPSVGSGAAGGAVDDKVQLRLELVAEVVAGAIFALGLGFSGMTRPSKVAGFLTVAAPSWDLSLPFVMAGAVAVAMVAYQGVLRFRIMNKPIVCPTFQIPNSTTIDSRLLVGGLVFGAGWGLAGMCPGPALVAALYGDPHVLSFVAAMAAGMIFEGRLTALTAAAALRQKSSGSS